MLRDADPASLALEVSACVAELGFLAAVLNPGDTIATLSNEEYALKEVLSVWSYLNLARGFIELLELMNGFGAPEEGEDFSGGSRKFSHEIIGDLQHAAATSWIGSPLGAAYNYNCRNSEQQNRANKIADADSEIKEILSNQGFQVERGRQGFAGTRISLIGATVLAAKLVAEAIIAIEIAAATNDPAAKVTATALVLLLVAFVEVASVVAALTAFGLICTLIDEGRQNERHIRSARRKYIDVVEQAGAFMASAAPTVARPTVASESIAPSFSGIADKLPEKIVLFDSDGAANSAGNSHARATAPATARGTPAFLRHSSAGPERVSHPSQRPGKRPPGEKTASTTADPDVDTDTNPATGVPADLATVNGAAEPAGRTLADRMGF